MAQHSASVIVNAPVDQVYTLFTHFNDFPKFMSYVTEVTYYDNQRSHWVVNVLGKHAWDAVNENWIENSQIGWRSVDGLENSGLVTFAGIGGHPDAGGCVDLLRSAGRFFWATWVRNWARARCSRRLCSTTSITSPGWLQRPLPARSILPLPTTFSTQTAPLQKARLLPLRMPLWAVKPRLTPLDADYRSAVRKSNGLTLILSRKKILFNRIDRISRICSMRWQ